MRSLLLAMLFLLAQGCGSKGDSGDESVTDPGTEAAKGSATATASTETEAGLSSGTAKGAKATAPVGALSVGQELTISETTQPAAFTAVGSSKASSPIQVAVKGSDGTAVTSVTTPLTIAIPVTETALNLADDGSLSTLCALLAPADGGAPIVWRRADIEVSSKSAAFQTKKLGVFQLFFCGTATLSGFVEYSARATWAAITTTDAPTARSGPNAVAVGTTKMFLWGGADADGNLLTTGAVYDVSKGTWSATSTTNAPTARANCSVVAISDHEVMIWGSQTPSYLSDGAIYNLTTNTWTTVATENAPTARGGHSMVWTGSKVIVWGGKTSDGYTDTGKLYDPAKNTWETMLANEDAIPEARANHAALWTGSELVVFGGGNSSTTVLSGGAKYSPTTKTWTKISTTGEPSAVLFPTAVWTETQVLLWGGANALTGTNVGGLYTPSTDKWTSTSTTRSAVARGLHKAVYTSGHMFVLHGAAISLAVPTLLEDSLYAYTPSTNTWEHFGNELYTKRILFASALVGSTIVVWGGCDNVVSSNKCTGTTLGTGYTFVPSE